MSLIRGANMTLLAHGSLKFPKSACTFYSTVCDERGWIFINTAQLFLWKIYRPRSLWVRNLRKIKQTNKKKKTVHMKQYSSNGCNIFAFNILVKDGYDGILRQYEVLCTRDAVTCITCRRTWSSTVQVKSRYYHSHYNSFTAWPQRVTSSHLTFPCSHANDCSL